MTEPVRAPDVFSQGIDVADGFVRRMKEELERSRDVLRPDELDEYRQALTAYESLAAEARED